jgi:hypothetical protein
MTLVSPIGGDTGGSGNLFSSLSNVARLAAHPKFVWVVNAIYDGTIIYNDPVFLFRLFNGLVGSPELLELFYLNCPIREYL